jgi:16S rRNA processing protein RimM
LISLGKILKVRGNKGEVVFSPSPEGDLSILKKGESVHLKSTKYQKSCRVEYLKEISGACVVKFTNINTINEALKFVGYTVFGSLVAKENVKKPDLVGFTVTDIHGRHWGEIVNVETTPLNKTLEIRDADDVLYVPFDDSIIKEIKKKERVVVIDPPEGLKELNE